MGRRHHIKFHQIRERPTGEEMGLHLCSQRRWVLRPTLRCRKLERGPCLPRPAPGQPGSDPRRPVTLEFKCGMIPQAHREVRQSKFAKGLAHSVTSINAKKINRILFHHLLSIRLNRMKLLGRRPKTVERQQNSTSYILRALVTTPPKEPVDLKTFVKCFPVRLVSFS